MTAQYLAFSKAEIKIKFSLIEFLLKKSQNS